MISHGMLRLQDEEANCGPVTGQCALAAIGLRVAPRAMESLCGYSRKLGTPPEGLRRGLEACGADVRVLREAKGTIAWSRLLGEVRGGCSACVMVDNDTHWIAVTGCIGERVNVFDPARGPYILGKGEFLERWGSEGVRQPYYALLVSEAC